MYHGARAVVGASCVRRPARRPGEPPIRRRATARPVQYLLLDVSEISDDELREGAMMTALVKLVALCFKHARTRDEDIGQSSAAG